MGLDQDLVLAGAPRAAVDGGVQRFRPSDPTLMVSPSRQGGGEGCPLCSTVLLHMVVDLYQGEQCQRKEMKKLRNERDDHLFVLFFCPRLVLNVWLN